MFRVLTVDDSRAVRTIVRKQITEMGYEPFEAEDGEQGLVRLAETPVDLVLLDVTMPVLDGLGMLERMRAKGIKTPVIMLTSESKRSIVAGAMRLGLDDYILKPFKPEELRVKMEKVLGTAAPAPSAAAPSGLDAMEAVMFTPAAPPAPVAKPASTAAAAQGADVLLIDDMENVGVRLRALAPPHVKIQWVATSPAALVAAREHHYRVILVDNELGGVELPVLVRQLRMLQPEAVLVALPLHSPTDISKDLRAVGFDDLLYKPFNANSVSDFLFKYFDNQVVLACEENIFKAGGFSGREEKLAGYYSKLLELFQDALKKAASACYDEVILDLSLAPPRQERLPRALIFCEEQSKASGIHLKLVGTPDHRRLLAGFAETKALAMFDSIQEARQGT